MRGGPTLQVRTADSHDEIKAVTDCHQNGAWHLIQDGKRGGTFRRRIICQLHDPLADQLGFFPSSISAGGGSGCTCS